MVNEVLIGNINPFFPAIESNSPVERAFMDMEIVGPLKLFSVLKEDIELIDTEIVHEVNENDANDWFLAYNRDYFIGYSEAEVEQISPSNFKKIAKKYFANTLELAQNIGKKGFRYKNLPSMILYYNEKMIEGKAVTKEDKLLVKEIK